MPETIDVLADVETTEDLTIKRFGFVATKIERDDDEMPPRSVKAKISTETVDRTGEVLLAKGCDVGDYRKNPVVLWAHSWDRPPVGKNLWIKKTEGAVLALTQFADTEFGNEVFELYRFGALKAFSVGFPMMGSECREPTAKERQREGWDKASRVYTRWSLVEYSAVPIPANPDALAEAVGKAMRDGGVREETIRGMGLEVPAQKTLAVVRKVHTIRQVKVIPSIRVCGPGLADVERIVARRVARALGRATV